MHFPEILPVSFSPAPPTPLHIGTGCLHHGTLPQASLLKSVCCPLLASADTASNVGVSRSPRAHCPHPACPQHRIHAITQLRTCIRNNVNTGPGKGRPWSDIPGHEDIMGFLGAVFCGSNLAPWLSLATGRTQSIS